MEALTYLDTHVAFWLFASGAEAALGEAAREEIRVAADLRISPMVRLELQYLFEVGRIGVPAMPILDELQASLDLRICDASFAAVVREAEKHAWTGDPFDRLIVAQASVQRGRLVTKDRTILDHYEGAVW